MCLGSEHSEIVLCLQNIQHLYAIQSHTRKCIANCRKHLHIIVDSVSPLFTHLFLIPYLQDNLVLDQSLYVRRTENQIR